MPPVFVITANKEMKYSLAQDKVDMAVRTLGNFQMYVPGFFAMAKSPVLNRVSSILYHTSSATQLARLHMAMTSGAIYSV